MESPNRLNKMEQRSYSTVYRIMHWLIAFCVLGILLTIFLRLTWFSRESITTIIQGYSTDNGLNLLNEDASKMARKIRSPMWQWHIYFGYVLTGLYAIRMALPFFGQMKIVNPLKRQLTSKEKFQYWVYIIFYGCVAVSLTTGLMMEFGPKQYKETLEDVHVLSIYYLATFIILHIGGVLLAEFTNQKGIVSRIVSGMKK